MKKAPAALQREIRSTNGRSASRIFKNYWQLYVMLLLPVIYILIYNYGPMIGLQMAFKDYTPRLGMFKSPWVGLKYFEKFFNDYQFTRTIINTVRTSVYSLAVNFPFPIILALCINLLRNEKYKKTVQMVMYAPHFISIVVLVGMMNQILNPYVGLYGNIYKMFTGSYAPNILADSKSFIHLYVWSGVWQNMGYSSIIYLAALSGISPDLHEAAQIDGASRFKRVLHVDIPGIVPTIVIMLILNCGRIMNIGFEKIYLMQNPINLKESQVISTLVYEKSFGGAGGSATKYSYSTAIGLFNSVVNFVLIVTVNKITSKLSETSLW